MVQCNRTIRRTIRRTISIPDEGGFGLHNNRVLIMIHSKATTETKEKSLVLKPNFALFSIGYRRYEKN